jgi:hypothetical protein
MSEFELGILRQRSVEVIRQKAKRGELHFILPAGLCWGTSGNMGVCKMRFIWVL